MPLDMGPFFVIILRLAVPPLMFRWPFAGLVAAILADNFDTIIIAAIGSGTFEDYTLADKLLDTYFLAILAFVSLRWENKIAKITSISLFAYRLVGVVALSVTGDRAVLFIFPNVFEVFFIYQVVTMKWFPHLQVDDYRRLALVIPILLVLKLLQEYIVHVAEFHILCTVYTYTLDFLQPLWTILGARVSEFIDEYFTLWC